MNGLFRTAAKILEGQKIMNPISLIPYSMGFRKQINFFFLATRFRIFIGYILMTNPYLGIQKQSLQCLFREMGTHCFSCFTTNMDASVAIRKEKHSFYLTEIGLRY